MFLTCATSSLYHTDLGVRVWVISLNTGRVCLRVPLSELLRVFRADACTQPVYSLQQVVVLPVHRCASASESACYSPVLRDAPTAEAQCHPASWPAPERLQLAASDWTRQDNLTFFRVFTFIFQASMTDYWWSYKVCISASWKHVLVSLFSLLCSVC